MKQYSILAEIALFLVVFFFAIRPIENFDFWFHLKYGEHIINTQSLPFTDQYSHTAFGSPAIPYEWLFQVALYLIYSTFGTFGVQALIVFFAISYTFIFRQILWEIFKVPLLPRMLLTSSLFILGYDFWVERPQIVAYALFLTVLYLVLKRVFLGKNWLWISIPLFLIWTNLHASIILGLYLFASFAVVALIRRDFKLFKELTFFGLINFGITLLPPLSIKVYQLLYLFVDKRDFITLVISEWVPLYKLNLRFYIYLVIMGLSAAALIWAYLKKETRSKLTLFLPFVPLGLFVISGVRQTQFSLPVILLLFVPLLQKFKIIRFLTVSGSLIVIGVSIFFLYLYQKEVNSVARLYPTQAIPFIKNLAGNMFNEYHMGGYLMYHLGPSQKTFIDGRTDMFLPQVLPEYDKLINDTSPDEEFKNHFHSLVEKYHVSWVILTTERFAPIRRLARLLREDPGWKLVFFDDNADVYIKGDGLNSEILEKYTITAASPFGKSLYKKGQREKARLEYEKMYALSPSAIALNAQGYMLLEEKKFKEAEELFLQALKITPYAAAPKMNLAELSYKYGQIDQAISLYREAIADEPERGLAYLRLGQLIIESGGSKIEAKKIWQKGLTVTPDEEILKKLQDALKTSI